MLRLLGLPTSFGVGLFPSKAFLVLAFVLLSQKKCISRKEVVQYIWGEVSTKKALSNLRYVLTKIRIWERLNNTKLFDVSSKTISLSIDSAKIDVEILLGIDRTKPDGALECICELYHGNLLNDVNVLDEKGQEFLVSGRRRILNHTIEIALGSSRQTIGAKVELALETLTQDAPFNEAIFRARIRNLCLIGQKDFAKSLFRSFQSQLRAELGCEVEGATLNLASQMLPSSFAMPRAKLFPARGSQLETNASSSELPRVLILPPLRDPFNQTSEFEHVLARGLLDEVSTLLGRMRTLLIIAPFTANQLEHLDYSSAAQKVNADYVVRSTAYMRLPSNKYSSLSIKLSDISTHQILLSEVVQLDHRNLARLHVDIADTIANAVASNISSNEVAQFGATGNPNAYVHYILGQQCQGYDLKSLRNAKKHFRSAIQRLPMFSSGHAMLSRTKTNEWLILQRHEQELLIQSMKDAKIAIRLDKMNPLGHRELGHAKLYTGDLNGCLSSIGAAVKLAPNIADIIADQADMYIHSGDGKFVLKILKKAMLLNPLPPDSYHWTAATAYFLNEDFEKSLETFNLMQNKIPVARLMAACAAKIGDHKLASIYRVKWMDNYPDFRLSEWAQKSSFKNSPVTNLILDAYRSAGFN